MEGRSSSKKSKPILGRITLNSVVGITPSPEVGLAIISIS